MNPDMVLDSCPGPDVIMAQVSVHATQIGMVPMAAWPLDTNMAPGGNPDYRSLLGPQW